MATSRAATELIKGEQGSDKLLVRKASLKVVRGDECGKSVTLGEQPIVIGSSRDCDLALRDPAVSHRQFELRATPDGYLLRDLGSTNGTFVGGLRVREVWLASGAKIGVGRSQLLFTELDEREQLPLSRHESFGKLLGRSQSMRRCFALLEAAAATDSTVLIEGESGTGKELAAESLHERSGRSDGPWVVVDCGAIPSELMESELFGHVKGAFTGAAADRVGAFEAAHRGTLFLDEIGELDLRLQPKLLRFLEKREVQRVGSQQRQAVDVRVIAATHRKLEGMVAEGTLRQDLFYRLAVLRVHLPPLRERRDDVAYLALELARQLRPGADPGAWLDSATLGVLAAYDWPGNVRELRNVLERLAAMPQLSLELGAELARPEPGSPLGAGCGSDLLQLSYHQAKQRVLEAFERDYLQALLQQEQGVVVRAAERAQVPRQTLFRLIRKHGLRGAEDA
ncbi:MAG: sigma 54-dependent Fis family transcriptional regulator [Deltaproteobacteria bacterium]|nr:sigma 54-dependent Fis family transcriptional regulator [Deltaproteobacteria bacterium]